MDTVSELMTPTPQVVRADEALVVAAHRMTRLGIRHLPVVDADGALCGVVTDFAVFSRGGLVGAHDELWIPFEEQDAALTCGAVAAPFPAAGEDDDLTAALRKLADHAEDAVVVTNAAGHPVGIVTEHDGVRLAAAVLPDHVLGVDGGSRPVVSVRRDEPAAHAVAKMAELRARHLLVVEPDGRLFGVLSYGDVVADQAMLRKELTAEDVVRRGRLIVERGTPSLRDVALLMGRHKIGCVPLLDPFDRPRGVVTRTDVLRALVGALENESLFAPEE